MDTEYREKNSIPDLYAILGLTKDVCEDPECDKIIEKAYLRKAKICHPDRNPGKDVKEVFHLITCAYEILSREKTRNNYNNKLSLSQQTSNDFNKLKKTAIDYQEAEGGYIEPSKEQKKLFESEMSAMNDKHGYSTLGSGPMGESESKKSYQRLVSERGNMYAPERIFDDGNFNLNKFNAAFDKYHVRSDTDIVPHNGVPLAFDYGTKSVFGSFSNLQSGDIFAEDVGDYCAVGQCEQTKITRDDIAGIGNASYVTGHAEIGDDYYSDLKKKIRDRKAVETEIGSMSYGDYKRDDTAGYGIYEGLGISYDDTVGFDNENDLSKKFDKLLAERGKSVPSNRKWR